MRSVSVVGLGKLGACMAACMADRGLRVHGLDVNRETIARVNSGEPPVYEPGLAELVARSGARLTAGCDYEAILDTDATFVVVPTPSEPPGGFSLRYAREAFQSIGNVLRAKRGYHLVVLTSTVLAGSTRYGLVPILEQAAGKHYGEELGVCYSPEFIALGSVIRDFLSPDFVLIGESDARAGDELENLYSAVLLNSPPSARMTFENAELAKIAVNSYVTMKITFANMLGQLCERIPGGDVDVVTSAVGLDRRIGGRYLKGGLGYGGPCFPRDNVALAFLARQLGCSAALPEATDRSNRDIVERLAASVWQRLLPGGRVAILGLTYKPGSVVLDEAQGLQLASRLSTTGARVIVHDPAALNAARLVLGEKVEYARTVEDAVREAQVIILTSDDPFYASVGALANAGPGAPTIIDCWRLLRTVGFDAAGYAPLGIGRSDAAAEARLTALWAQSELVLA